MGNDNPQSFEWDELKSHRNLIKHGFRFRDVLSIFEDPLAEYALDGGDHGEERWRIIGRVGFETLVVSFAVGAAGHDVFRIISAREATSHELRKHEEA